MISSEDKETWEEAARIIRVGGVVVFPTDTVYGIGCDPYNVEAIARVFAVKERSHLKALPLLLAEVSGVEGVTQGQNETAVALGEVFWPGALTLVVPKAGGLPGALGGGETVAVRVPDHAGLRYMIGLCGGAIAATSANISGLPDSQNAEEAAAYLGDRVDLIVDGGPARGGVPSTVVDCLRRPPVLLRVGAIGEEEIRRVYEEVIE